jgi:hypothetical protein
MELNLIKAFFKISRTEKILLVKGFLYVLLLYPLFYFIPLKYYKFFLNIRSKVFINPLEKTSYIQLVNKTINRIDHFAGYHLNCFVKAATFKKLLNEKGIESKLIFSVSKDGFNAFQSHASLMVDDLEFLTIGRTFTNVLILE